MTDRAAALTYYSLLSLFPALLFGVASLGYFGRQRLIADASDYLLQAGAPKETVELGDQGARVGAVAARDGVHRAGHRAGRPRCGARRGRSARSGGR